MCGIVGRFARNGQIGAFEPLIGATNLISHRGPDDGAWWSDGAFFFGHRRLSIIDLEHGGQPMATADGRYVIVFNGEIYNYVELRDQLLAQGVTFRTASDTEVILAGYVAWGTNLPQHLVGQFAFAIADRREQTLFLARDRFGEKPLFVQEAPTGVAFASELAPLAALQEEGRRIDPAALAGYLCLNYVPGDQTLLAGVQRIPPATWRLYTGSGVRQETYWTLPAAPTQPSTASDAELLDQLASRLDASVRIAMRSDVPVALFLSGGIDSSIVAESAVRQGHLQHAYCLDFAEAGFSEFPVASYVAERLGIEIRRVAMSTDLAADVLAIAEHADDPLADSSALPVWNLARGVARDYKVVVSGDGGDELFGGYLTYQATAYHQRFVEPLPRVLRRAMAGLAGKIPVRDGKVTASYKLMRFLRAADLPAAQAHFSWNGAWLPKDLSGLLSDAGRQGQPGAVLAELAARHGLSGRPGFSELQRADLADYLPNDILAKVDRMTMAHGLEARAPLLVPTVAEFAVVLPNRMTVAPGGPTKRILRDLATRVLGPEIGQARKQGFSIPVHRWLRGPLRELTEDLLSASNLDALGLIDTQAVLAAKHLHMTGRAQLGFELWGLLVLVAWHRARVLRRFDLAIRQTTLRRVVFPRGPHQL